jgi:hypothetical protein
MEARNLSKDEQMGVLFDTHNADQILVSSQSVMNRDVCLKIIDHVCDGILTDRPDIRDDPEKHESLRKLVMVVMRHGFIAHFYWNARLGDFTLPCLEDKDNMAVLDRLIAEGITLDDENHAELISFVTECFFMRRTDSTGMEYTLISLFLSKVDPSLESSDGFRKAFVHAFMLGFRFRDELVMECRRNDSRTESEK